MIIAWDLDMKSRYEVFDRVPKMHPQVVAWYAGQVVKLGNRVLRVLPLPTGHSKSLFMRNALSPRRKERSDTVGDRR